LFSLPDAVGSAECCSTLHCVAEVRGRLGA
jgi:hypothetical protein